MITKHEFIRRYEEKFSREEAEFLEEWLENIRTGAAEDARLRVKDELREELMTQKDMAFIKAEFESIRRESRREFESIRREMDIRFTEQDKRMRIYAGVIIALLILLHPSVGALLTKVFAG